MENRVDSSKEIFKFHYQSTTRRPKRLQNNVFFIYSPEKVRLQPGERKFSDMQIKLYFSKNIECNCRILYTLQNQGLKLLNSKTISQEINVNIDNLLTVDENNLSPWKLTFELYNTSFTDTFQIKKRQELGYFLITQCRGGEEIDFKFVKEKS